MKFLLAFVAIFITLPIWFYLLYKILVAVGASDLMWFMYWAYVPFSLFIGLFSKIIETN